MRQKYVAAGVSLWTDSIKNEAAIAATEISHNVQFQIDIGVQMQCHAIEGIGCILL